MKITFGKSVVVVGYVAMIAGVLWALQSVRGWTQESYGNTLAQAEWQDWRAAVEQQETGNASVRRRVPKSSEPPALVLMRDYYLVCIVISLVMTSALFATLVFAVRGVFFPSSPAGHDSGDSRIQSRR